MASPQRTASLSLRKGSAAAYVQDHFQQRSRLSCLIVQRVSEYSDSRIFLSRIRGPSSILRRLAERDSNRIEFGRLQAGGLSCHPMSLLPARRGSEGHPEVARISRISPAYDLNPVPLTEKARELTTWISEEGPDADLDLARAAAPYFALDLVRANVLIDEVAAALDGLATESATAPDERIGPCRLCDGDHGLGIGQATRTRFRAAAHPGTL